MDPDRRLAPLVTPAVLGLALAVDAAAARAGLTAGAAASAGVLAAGAALLLLERLTPHTPAWRPSARAWRTDAAHTVVTARVVSPAVHAGVIATVGAWVAPAAAWDLVPLPVQVAAAVVIADLGAWLAHRWMHTTDLGWRIHQVHHSATALHVLAAARTHPLNAALTSGAELTPLVLLGLPPDALACWTVIKVVNGLLQHSNVAIDPGWLGEVLATAEAHRWHHSAAREESDTNFGNTTVLWDRLAGTRLAPTDRRPGADVGVPGPGDGYLDHLLAPLRPPPVAVDGRARAE